MGATTLMVGSMIAGAATSVYQGHQQNQMIQAQAQMDKEAAESNAKNQEIERLRQARQVHDANITKALSSGFTFEGTMGDLMDENIDLTKQDVKMIHGNKGMAIGQINAGASNAQSANNMNTAGSLINTGTQGVISYNQVKTGNKW